MAAVEVLVLVVEDEPLIHDLLRIPLEDGGFAVRLASSGDEALGALEAPGANYRALVTDTRLGRNQTSGWELARRGRELNAALAVVYMSGDGEADWPASGVPGSIMLNKPFAPFQVVTAVAQLLNASDTAPA